jgi:hypothetical protein
MPMFKLPLSGDVAQNINPWSYAFSPIGGQYGLINISLGQSSAPQVEADVLTDVAGYGKQLGKIADALAALIADRERHGKLHDKDQKALDAFMEMHAKIAEVKRRHSAREG